ncbi:hypothetical protein HDU67_000949 [Dinochytrium kinnereticum]|nr:hypothetical protein HDU67_000949 [Dinochytrium kinnereticum]
MPSKRSPSPLLATGNITFDHSKDELEKRRGCLKALLAFKEMEIRALLETVQEKRCEILNLIDEECALEQELNRRNTVGENVKEIRADRISEGYSSVDALDSVLSEPIEMAHEAEYMVVDISIPSALTMISNGPSFSPPDSNSDLSKHEDVKLMAGFPHNAVAGSPVTSLPGSNSNPEGGRDEEWRRNVLADLNKRCDAIEAEIKRRAGVSSLDELTRLNWREDEKRAREMQAEAEVIGFLSGISGRFVGEEARSSKPTSRSKVGRTTSNREGHFDSLREAIFQNV